MSLKSEFTRQGLRFCHENIKDFYDINVCGKCCRTLWILRLLFALFSVVHLIYFAVLFKWKFIIFLSNWGLILYASYFLAVTVFSGIYLLKKTVYLKAQNNVQLESYSTPEVINDDNLPWHAKFLWLLMNITLVVGGIIVLLFWIFLFSPTFFDTSFNAYVQITIHGVIYMMVVIDCVFLHSIPIRLLHVGYAILFSLCYLFFSVIYTKQTNSPIYPMLNWNSNPGQATLFCFCGLILAFGLQIIFYALHRIKKKISQNHYSITL